MGRIKIQWSPNFAYAIGLMVTDGNLSIDGRHMTFVSKDIEQIRNFIECLGLKVKIGKTFSGYNGNMAHRLQFGDVLFYKYLLSIGLSPAKSKTIGSVNIPRKYFFDYLRGCFDGDGSFYSYWDPRWKSSFMFYTDFVSASLKHILWLRQELKKLLGVNGHISKSRGRSYFQLRYAKAESMKVLRRIYYSDKVVFLSRKRLKIDRALAIISKSL